jgi:hypothetical protein
MGQAVTLPLRRIHKKAKDPLHYHPTTAQKVRFDDMASFGDTEYLGLSEVQFFGPAGPEAVTLPPS